MIPIVFQRWISEICVVQWRLTAPPHIIHKKMLLVLILLRFGDAGSASKRNLESILNEQSFSERLKEIRIPFILQENIDIWFSVCTRRVQSFENHEKNQSYKTLKKIDGCIDKLTTYWELFSEDEWLNHDPKENYKRFLRRTKKPSTNTYYIICVLNLMVVVI